MIDLRASQAWLLDAITAESAPPDAEARLTKGPHLEAHSRLGIYRQAYRSRLVECLSDDYPAVRHAIGADAFEELCAYYVARHPPQSFSLNWYGRHLAAVCREQPAHWAGFAADLARVEWAIVEVIHAADAVVDLSALASLPSDAWGAVMLRPSPTLRLLSLSHPANAYYQAFREGRTASLPLAAPSFTVVHRDGMTVWRTDLSEAMHAVLQALAGGLPLERALESPNASAAEVGEWFQRWIASAWFVGARIG